MKQLKNLIEDPGQRKAIISDCVKLIHDEVASKTGFSGAAVKLAFKAVNALKPNMIEESVDHLLDDFIARLQPFFEDYQKDGSMGSLSGFMGKRSSQVAEALLGITDERARNAKNKTLVKAYNSLRPKGKVHVEAAAPGIGRVLDGHISRL